MKKLLRQFHTATRPFNVSSGSVRRSLQLAQQLVSHRAPLQPIRAIHQTALTLSLLELKADIFDFCYLQTIVEL